MYGPASSDFGHLFRYWILLYANHTSRYMCAQHKCLWHLNLQFYKIIININVPGKC